jgi:hypothetical protein
MSKLSLLRAAGLLFILILVMTTVPTGAAACSLFHTTTTYYAYVEGNSYYCDIPPVSPPCPSCWDYLAVGGRERDCEGNLTTWGINPQCPGNTVIQSERCPACEV